MIVCRISIEGKRGQHVTRGVALAAKPNVGDYVCIEDGSLGVKVAIVLVSPNGVTCKVKEEVDGDFDFDGLVREGWTRS